MSEERTDARVSLLVIDDEAMMLRSLVRQLGRYFDVTPADAEQAIELVRSGRRFDCVLCDIAMPERDGVAVYSSIREIDPAQASRWIFMSGGIVHGPDRDFVESHDVEVLLKPFRTDDLRTTLNRARASGRFAASA